MDQRHSLVDEIAAPSLGLVDRGTLVAAGLTDGQIDALVRRGLLIPVHPGVYRTVGTTMTYRRWVLAACMAAGPAAAAHGRSALKVWRVIDGEQPVEVVVPRGQCPEPAHVVLHRSTDLVPQHVVIHRGVRTTTPARALVDAGAVMRPAALAEAVEKALTMRLVSVRGLRVALEEVARPGRRGVGPLRRHLDRRSLGDKRPESMLEPVAARLLLREHGIGPIEYQRTIVLDGRELRPDFHCPWPLVVVEVDGLDAHGSREALDRDLARQNLLVAHGYQVLRYTRTHLRRPRGW
jgi:very-short-patch-repair endonuclease